MYILKHEALHFLHNHFSRATELHKKNHNIWNIATDCAINQQCNENHSIGDNIDYRRLSKQLNINLEPNLTAEMYFNEIYNNADKNLLESFLSGFDIDSHECWELSDVGSSDIINDIIAKTLNSAIESTLRARGNVPSFINDIMKIYLRKNEIDWKSEFHNIIGTRKADNIPTIYKKNRRFPNRRDIKGYKKQKTFTALLVVDVSGSVKDEELNKFISEILFLCQSTNTELNLIQVDSEARKPETVDYSTTVFNRKGNGGTVLKPAIDMAKEHNLEYDCVVVCTDGQISNSDVTAYNSLGVPILWVITPNGVVASEMNFSNSKAVKLKNNF